MSASITTSRNVLTTSRAVVATSAAQATSRAVVATSAAQATSRAVAVSSQPVSSQVVSSQSTTRRARTTTASATPTPTQTVVPFDASSERRADSQRTNKILIGIFTGFGVILLGLVAFQLLRCYKRRRKSTPLPPPREGTMSQLGYRHSRGVSMYKEFPTAEFGRPPSMMKHASGSGFVDTPSVESNAASMEKLRTDEPGRTSSDPRRSTSQIPREASPDNSLVDSTIVDSTLAPTDEEMGRRLSPLGSRSDSPSNPSLPRPPSQAQVLQPRPESRARYPRPNSVASTSRHSYLAPSWQYGSAQRNSVHGSLRPTSYYASGNHGAPHSPHARDRVGLMMPQPLAPELFNYALSGRHDMGLDFTQGGWGSHGNLANPQDSNSTLAPPMRVRTDSWVAQSRTPSSSDSPLTSDAPAKDGSLPRGRSSRSEIPQP